MSKFIKYLLLYIIIYFIVDFTTGFNSDFNYWISMNGPLLGIIIYSLSGLFFSYLIYKRNFEGKKLFLIAMVYALFFEIVVFKNPLLALENLFQGLPMLVIVYSLVVFLPKWIVDKSLKKNLKVALVLIIFWLLIAVVAFINNPHKV